MARGSNCAAEGGAPVMGGGDASQGHLPGAQTTVGNPGMDSTSPGFFHRKGGTLNHPGGHFTAVEPPIFRLPGTPPPGGAKGPLPYKRTTLGKCEKK